MTGPAQPPAQPSASATSGQTRAISPAVNGWNAEYLDAEYQRYKASGGDLSNFPPDLAAFFQGFDLALARGGSSAVSGGGSGGGDLAALQFQSKVTDLIEAYRSLGHLAARIDPFDRPPAPVPALALSAFGLTDQDLDRAVNHGTLPLPPTAPLRDVIEFLETTYCRSIGVQTAHMTDSAERDWILQRCEVNNGRINFTRGEKAHILEQLVRSEQFEKFLQNRYPGDKRFSLEGGEVFIPLLDRIIEAGGNMGVEEMVIGMAHRGRLNLLNNIMGKTYEQIFTEFEDSYAKDTLVSGGGDVKYHKGYSSDRPLRNGRTMRLAMASNPSHLESVNAVVEGRCRAKQRLRNDTERTRVIPILVHGDAAVIGQGVVAETLNLSQLEGYTTGGTIHLVINNLVGFTTGPQDARSTRYCTDIALMCECPVLHVNGMDPEAVVAAGQISVEYRQKFKKDIFIDVYCYRKYGHNEQDEASFTQPILTSLVKAQKPVLARYSERLAAEGVLTEGDLKTIQTRLDQALEAAQAAAKAKPVVPTIDPGSRRWSGVSHQYNFEPVATGVPMKVLQEICTALGRTPEGFNVNPKLKKLLDDRSRLPETKQISYADAETLAFGTLLLDGHALRLSGQDARRGTFSHRHAVLRDFQTEEPFIPLNNMRPIAAIPDDAGRPGPDGKITQGRLCVYDSPLSEASVMGFDYGYSLADPNMLVMWEGQFGDFCNGAQTIIDQYIASAEVKWQRWSGLVLLLPHGYEGAGPEHSSARMERFLALCGNDNMQVVYPSTAGQCFHMFRRQLKAKYRKPLIVMTPKSMLRVPTGTIDELTKGHFHTLIDDPAVADPKPVKTVLMCSGKVYFELAARRDALKRSDIAIVRAEQLYPFDAHLCKKILARYPGAKVTWVQEEPRNAGACMFMLDLLHHKLGLDVTDISRPTSATPAVGSKGKSKYEQEAILTAAVGPLDKDAHHHDHPAPKDAHKDIQKDGKTNGTHAAPPASPAKGPKSKSGH